MVHSVLVFWRLATRRSVLKEWLWQWPVIVIITIVSHLISDSRVNIWLRVRTIVTTWVRLTRPPMLLQAASKLPLEHHSLLIRRMVSTKHISLTNPLRLRSWWSKTLVSRLHSCMMVAIQSTNLSIANFYHRKTHPARELLHTDMESFAWSSGGHPEVRASQLFPWRVV